MNDNDPRDDIGLPYDPDSPEGFSEMMRQHFDEWWNELDPPSAFEGVSLEKETARATWNAAEAFLWERIEMTYDCMQATKEVWEQKSLEEAGFIVSKFSDDSFSFTLDDFLSWHEQHAVHIRREYKDGTVTITFRPD